MRIPKPWLLSMLLCTGAACGAETTAPDADTASDAAPLEEVALGADEAKLDEAARSLRVTPLSDVVGARAATATIRVLRTRAEYRAYFGHAAPAEVDFAREWVAFYAAGQKPTGGFSAAIDGITLRRGVLVVATHLETPGAGCAVTEALTRPFALVRFARPVPPPRAFAATHRTVASTCEPPPPPPGPAPTPVVVDPARLAGSWEATGMADSGHPVEPAPPGTFQVFGADHTVQLGCGTGPAGTWQLDASGTTIVVTLGGGSVVVNWVVVQLDDTTLAYVEGGDIFYYRRAACP